MRNGVADFSGYELSLQLLTVTRRLSPASLNYLSCVF